MIHAEHRAVLRIDVVSRIYLSGLCEDNLRMVQLLNNAESERMNDNAILYLFAGWRYDDFGVLQVRNASNTTS